ncbi:hypothetical protein Tco_0072156 [Tanacetum coccineum]
MVLGIAPVAIIDRQLPFEYTITSRSTDVVVPLPAAPAADSQAQVLSQWNAVYDAYNEAQPIAPVAIIDRQLPFEYTITSRSTDVVVMALPVQNINHSAFRSMPLPAAPAADSQAQVLSQWNAVYDAYNEVACLLLGSMTPELHRQFENPLPYDMIKELKSMFENQAGVESKSHMVLGIAPVAIIDRQLPFEYTITSRSTDVVVMALPVQNINHSAFRFPGTSVVTNGIEFLLPYIEVLCYYLVWVVSGIAPVAIIDRQLPFEYTIIAPSGSSDCGGGYLVLRVENKMYVIEQPLHAAPAADSQAQFENPSPYDMIKELKFMFEKQAGVERFDLIQTFHACKQEEGKPVAAYVLQMKGYVDQLERLGYMLPHDLIVGLILNGLTKDFARFVRNYNMHNMGKTIGELHAMIIEYEKGLPKKAETPQVMMIKGGKIQKANKKSLKAKSKRKANGKGKAFTLTDPNPPSKHPTKDDTYHHCKEVGHWKRNCHVYLAELLKKKKQVGSASSSGIFTIELFSFPSKSWVYDTGCGTHICNTKQGFREARKLKQGALYLYVGNGVCAKVEAIRRSIYDGNLTTMPFTFWEYALEFENMHSQLMATPLQNHQFSNEEGLEKDSPAQIVLSNVERRSNSLGVLMNPTSASTPKEVKRMQNVPYASAVGSIMYAVRCTRPDVAFANTKDMFLVYGGNPEAELRVDCYCDTGFETDIDDMKSQTGYVSF